MRFFGDTGGEPLDGPLQTRTEPPPEPEPPPPEPPLSEPPPSESPPPALTPPESEPPRPVPSPARDERQDSLSATRLAQPLSQAEAQAWVQRAQQDLLRDQAETVVLQSQAAQRQAELTQQIVASALDTLARLQAARSTTAASPKSGAAVAGESVNRVLDSLRELVQTALVVRGAQPLLAQRPAPPAAPSSDAARTGAAVEGEGTAGAGTAGAGAAGPAGDGCGDSPDLGALFPDQPAELPLSELRDVLLTYAAAKKKGGPP